MSEKYYYKKNIHALGDFLKKIITTFASHFIAN